MYWREWEVGNRKHKTGKCEILARPNMEGDQVRLTTNTLTIIPDYGYFEGAEQKE